MKVVILCGGRGTRLNEDTGVKPKPMVEVGDKPILWHIMKIYACYGFNEFILCLGYQGQQIKEYFLNYEAMNSDFTICLGKKDEIQFHTNHLEHSWTITFVDTGEYTQTGGRLKRIRSYVKDEEFMVTYGDGVANINVKELLEFHRNQHRIGTVTAVHPSSRFGELITEGTKAVRFEEKRGMTEGLINGGFFVFNRSFFEYLSDEPECHLEREPLENLARDGQLSVFVHSDFWQCMDTKRELDALNHLWQTNRAQWKVW